MEFHFKKIDPLLPRFDPPTSVLLSEHAHHYAMKCKQMPMFTYTKLDPKTLSLQCKQM